MLEILSWDDIDLLDSVLADFDVFFGVFTLGDFMCRSTILQ